MIKNTKCPTRVLTGENIWGVEVKQNVKPPQQKWDEDEKRSESSQRDTTQSRLLCDVELWQPVGERLPVQPPADTGRLHTGSSDASSDASMAVNTSTGRSSAHTTLCGSTSVVCRRGAPCSDIQRKWNWVYIWWWMNMRLKRVETWAERRGGWNLPHINTWNI